jgi:hypothetical protein
MERGTSHLEARWRDQLAPIFGGYLLNADYNSAAQLVTGIAIQAAEGLRELHTGTKKTKNHFFLKNDKSMDKKLLNLLKKPFINLIKIKYKAIFGKKKTTKISSIPPLGLQGEQYTLGRPADE